MNAQDVVNELVVRLKDGDKTQAQLARELGVPAPVLCGVLKGDREPTPQILDAIGMHRVITYEFKPKPKRGGRAKQ